MRAKLLLCVLFIAATPSIASASDYWGLVAIASFALIAVPWVALNLVLAIILAFMRRYASRSFALKHSCVASAGPVLAICLALYEMTGSPGYTWAGTLELVAMDAGLLGIAWLPMLVHRFQRPDARPARAA